MKTATKRFISPIMLSLSLLICGASPSALGERVAIPLGQQGNHWNIDRPKTGLTKKAVINQYGEPGSKTGPVGEPPIYTWTYPKFKVVFEGNHVIHSVVKHQAKE